MSPGLAPQIVKRLMAVLSRPAAQGTGNLLIKQFTALALKEAHDAHVLSRCRFSFSGAPKMLRQNSDILHKAYLA